MSGETVFELQNATGHFETKSSWYGWKYQEVDRAWSSREQKVSSSFILQEK